MKSSIRLGAAVLAAFAMIGCDDIIGTGDAGDVTIGFSTTSSTAAAPAGAFGAAASEVSVSGSNGTLLITDVAFLVNEFKLERDEEVCEDIEGEDDDACEEFETGLAFVDLPLTGGTVPVVTQPIPAGTYTEMKFEVEDADLDEAEDDEEGEEITAVLAAIAAAGYDDWPADASLVVKGSFTPTGGSEILFTAYFEAEIKIEMAFEPALVVDGETGTIDIEISPAAWFTNADGTVMDLSAYDYSATGAVVEFEAKMENGFEKVELEGFDEDDD